MLCMNSYKQDYIDECRSSIGLRNRTATARALPEERLVIRMSRVRPLLRCLRFRPRSFAAVVTIQGFPCFIWWAQQDSNLRPAD